ncbi:MAG: cob(I)yrinic acid a,c-diamide adenosyltransferase [Actinomycetota bacterium]|nr:cob(I)yrinic acid a,c-diamide adenosyltransferase [Actinomycetota bacterium]
MKNKKGLVLVNTGDGKGKTTAALGLALRAAGHQQKVLILQFIKGCWISGEVRAISSIPQIEIKQLGSGFIPFKQGKPLINPELKMEAEQALQYALEQAKNSSYDLIILDEINNMVDYGLASPEQVLNIINNKKPEMVLVLTGRNAHPKIIEAADTVTEMKQIKHAFQHGIKAIKGIEY